MNKKIKNVEEINEITTVIIDGKKVVIEGDCIVGDKKIHWYENELCIPMDNWKINLIILPGIIFIFLAVFSFYISIKEPKWTFLILMFLFFGFPFISIWKSETKRKRKFFEYLEERSCGVAFAQGKSHKIKKGLF